MRKHYLGRSLYEWHEHWSGNFDIESVKRLDTAAICGEIKNQSKNYSDLGSGGVRSKKNNES